MDFNKIGKGPSQMIARYLSPMDLISLCQTNSDFNRKICKEKFLDNEA